jgi:hypothetical protein
MKIGGDKQRSIKSIPGALKIQMAMDSVISKALPQRLII